MTRRKNIWPKTCITSRTIPYTFASIQTTVLQVRQGRWKNSLWSGSPRRPHHNKCTAIVFAGPPQPHGQTLLLQTPHTSAAEHRKVSLTLTGKPEPCWLAFTGLDPAAQAALKFTVNYPFPLGVTLSTCAGEFHFDSFKAYYEISFLTSRVFFRVKNKSEPN